MDRKTHNVIAVIAFLALCFLIIKVFLDIVNTEVTGTTITNAKGNSITNSRLKKIVYVNDQASIDSVRAGFRPNDLREDPKLNPQIGKIKDLSDSVRQIEWRYQDHSFKVTFRLDKRLDEAYSKLELGKRDFEPYLQSLAQDSSIRSIANQLNNLAKAKQFNDDQLIELVASFVQAIKYDNNKVRRLASSRQISYYTPYQTLYRDSGICLDKALLGIALYRELGVGAALLLYPRPINFEIEGVGHAAIGVQCRAGYGPYVNENYCYLETTSDIAIGLIPEMTSQGLILTNKNNYQDARSLGPVEITLRSQGKSYRAIESKRRLASRS